MYIYSVRQFHQFLFIRELILFVTDKFLTPKLHKWQVEMMFAMLEVLCGSDGVCSKCF
jgi:hypothetical protein